jgi:hypothetical protein
MRIRPVVVLPLVLLLGACANAPTGPGDGGGDGIAHGTAPTDLLVRVGYEGGFVPIEWNFRNLPSLSLFGDGTLVTPGAQIEIYPGPALPAISRRTVQEEGVQAILGEVLDAVERVPDDLGDMGSVGIADAATTVLTIRAGGVDRTIRAYALAELPDRPDGMSEDVFQARQRLSALVTRLGALDGWLPEGSLGAEDAYVAGAARLFVSDYRPAEDLPQEPVGWPLDGALASFGSGDGQPQGYRCGTVEGDEWQSVLDLAGASNELTPWTDGGDRFSIVVRPLLPDESGC